MHSVILILVELGALFNYLIGEEDCPQKEHFSYACMFVAGLFQGCTFFPAEMAGPCPAEDPGGSSGGCYSRVLWPLPHPKGLCGASLQ